MEKGGAENPNKINKYACACSIVASMISIIFGYGEFSTSIFFLFLFHDMFFSLAMSYLKLIAHD